MYIVHEQLTIIYDIRSDMYNRTTNAQLINNLLDCSLLHYPYMFQH